MPRVTILPVELTADLAAGESLLDAGVRAGVEMVAGCFNTACGTCVVAVEAGGEHLTPPTPAERALLQALGRDPARFRLACTARVRGGEVIIRQLD